MRFPRTPLVKLALAALVLAFVAGCSMARLGYANAEHIAWWWLNRYVDFTPEQEEWVREELRGFFAWHRQSELPEYARMMEDIRRRLQGPVDMAGVQAEIERIGVRLQHSVDYALPALARLALSLSERQIANIGDRFARDNEALEREWLQGLPEERRAARFDRLMKHAVHWFGSFGDEQKRRLRELSDARPLDEELWLAERRRRQQALLEMLHAIRTQRPEPATAARMLGEHARAVLENRGFGGNQESLDASRRRTAEMIAHVITIATPEQKAHAARRLDGLIRDCRALAGLPAPR